MRGRIKLRDDTSVPGDASVVDTAADDDNVGAPAEAESDPTDRKAYGLPRYIRLANGARVDTRRGTVPKQSHFTCGGCGQLQDFRSSLQVTGRLAPVAPYVLQCCSPERENESHPYGGRYFKAPAASDILRLIAAERDWLLRRDADLAEYWPREEMPYSYMTHQANFALPKQGYTHWWKMFNPRQLLIHAMLLQAAVRGSSSEDAKWQAVGAVQQYLRNQNMFCIWDHGYDKLAPFFSNSNYAPKNLPIENCVFGSLGRGNWTSSVEKVEAGMAWTREPWEVALPAHVEETGQARFTLPDAVLPGADIRCGSSTELPYYTDQSFDMVITDPPFGDNIFYSDLSNYFYAWLRLPLREEYPDLFGPTNTPNAQEALAPRAMAEEEANARYRSLLTGCWIEAHRVLKDGGLLAFTFHHSEDAQWAIVLLSLFDAGFILEQTFPIASDEMKGEGASFGAKGAEYDIIHVCRKRLNEPTPVSWPKMRQWVKGELRRLRGLLEAYEANELSHADIRVILRGKALEFYSRHYGKVFTGENAPLSIRDALLGINQLLDEGTGEPEERPSSILQPLAYQFLRLFGTKSALSRDDAGKTLRGTGLVQREFEEHGWVIERNKVVTRVPIKEQFELARSRPRKEMKTEIDQAHFLIGAALPGSGVSIEEELGRNTWAVRRSVEAVLQWYARTATEADVKQAADLAARLLRDSLEKRRVRLVQEQGYLFDDLDEV